MLRIRLPLDPNDLDKAIDDFLDRMMADPKVIAQIDLILGAFNADEGGSTSLQLPDSDWPPTSRRRLDWCDPTVALVYYILERYQRTYLRQRSKWRRERVRKNLRSSLSQFLPLISTHRFYFITITSPKQRMSDILDDLKQAITALGRCVRLKNAYGSVFRHGDGQWKRPNVHFLVACVGRLDSEALKRRIFKVTGGYGECRYVYLLDDDGSKKRWLDLDHRERRLALELVLLYLTREILSSRLHDLEKWPRRFDRFHSSRLKEAVIEAGGAWDTSGPLLVEKERGIQVFGKGRDG